MINIINQEEYFELYDDSKNHDGFIISTEILNMMVDTLGCGKIMLDMLEAVSEILHVSLKHRLEIVDNSEIVNTIIEVDELIEFIDSLI